VSGLRGGAHLRLAVDGGERVGGLNDSTARLGTARLGRARPGLAGLGRG